MQKQLEFGLDTFGDLTYDRDGNPHSQAHVLRNVVEQAVLADEVGVDCIGLGEHHRDDFAISAPEILLAAIAAKSKRIHLGSAVTVLSTDEPVRVFQRFSTLDAISNGRAEIILGRGSFTESFGMFGYSLEQYEILFEERLELFAMLLEANKTGKPVTWRGRTRGGMNEQRIFPPTESGTLKTWIGVGGSPESVMRAARYKLPLTLAIIGGDPRRFLPYVELYREQLEANGSPMLPIAVHSPGHIAPTDAQAKEELWPAYQKMRNKIGAERGWPPAHAREFEQEVVSGSLYCGSPETVAKRIAATIKNLGIDRFTMKYSSGPLAHELQVRSIELFGTKVVPLVRDVWAG
jgi:probable LLM family oxidoreductase